MTPGDTSFEVLGDQGLIASCRQRTIALLLAAAWLRDPQQQFASIHTCVIQVRNADGHIEDEHVVALADGPLSD